MTIAIDFDGVIHKYSQGWQNGEVYDPPIKGAATFIYNCMFKKNWSVFILSTRDAAQIEEWCRRVLFQNKELPFEITLIPNDVEKPFWSKKKNLGITNRKLAAHIYIDDRAFKFEGNYDGLMKEVEGFEVCGR